MKIQAIALAIIFSLSGLKANAPASAPKTTEVQNVQQLQAELVGLQNELKGLQEELNNTAPLNSHITGRVFAAFAACTHFWRPWISYPALGKAIAEAFALGNAIGRVSVEESRIFDSLDYFSIGIIVQTLVNEGLQANANIVQSPICSLILRHIFIVAVPLLAKLADVYEIHGPNAEVRNKINVVLADIKRVNQTLLAAPAA